MASVVAVERFAELRAPAERAWEWMCDPRGLALFRVNVFHASAECFETALRVGSRIEIEHRLGWSRESRVARITRLERFEIGWSEVKEGGRDWFPHSQRFTLTPRGSGCLLRNALRGTFHLPGAGWWLLPWYRHALPRILDLENRRIAAAVIEFGP